MLRRVGEVTAIPIFFVFFIVISHEGVQTIPLIKEVLRELAVFLVAFLLEHIKHFVIVTHVRVALVVLIISVSACNDYFFFFFCVKLIIVLYLLVLGFAATTKTSL